MNGYSKTGGWSWSSSFVGSVDWEPWLNRALLAESSGHQVPEGSVCCCGALPLFEAHGHEGFVGSCTPHREASRAFSDQDSGVAVFPHGRIFLAMMADHRVFDTTNLNKECFLWKIFDWLRLEKVGSKNLGFFLWDWYEENQESASSNDSCEVNVDTWFR
jgi:hypothetical protein